MNNFAKFGFLHFLNSFRFPMMIIWDDLWGVIKFDLIFFCFLEQIMFLSPKNNRPDFTSRGVAALRVHAPFGQDVLGKLEKLCEMLVLKAGGDVILYTFCVDGRNFIQILLLAQKANLN